MIEKRYRIESGERHIHGTCTDPPSPRSSSPLLPCPPPPPRVPPLLHHSKPLILPCHLQKILQPLSERLLAVPGEVNPTHPDTFVRNRELPKIGPNDGIRSESLFDIGRELEYGALLGVVHRVADGCPPGNSHLVLLLKPEDPLPIHRRKLACRLSRREALNKLLLVYRLHDAVDPTVTKGLFNRIIVRNSRFPALFLIEDQPDFLLARMVRSQPFPPGLAGFDVQSLADFHGERMALWFGYRLRVRQELLKSIQALRSLHPRLPLRNMFGGQAVAVWRDRLKVLCFGLKVPVACPIGDRLPASNGWNEAGGDSATARVFCPLYSQSE